MALSAILRNGKTGKQQSQKKIPPVNRNVVKWSDLIDIIQLQFSEPPAIKYLTDEEIQSMIRTDFKPNIANIPCHSQSVGCSIKLISDASHTDVYGYDNCHKSIIPK